MKKGIIPKLSMGVALVGAIALTSATRASADLQDTVTFTEPAETLIMPFDATTGHTTFHLVSRVGGDGDAVIATHWSFWSKDCSHLADVFICLTKRDTVVVDPTNLQGQIQTGQANVGTGPVVNLTGNRGMVTVTAFTASPDSLSRDECAPFDPSSVLINQLVGSWTIANTATNSAYGNDAIGVSTSVGLDPSTFFDSVPFFIQTFNPESLQDSEVIFITAEFDGVGSGNGAFGAFEFGPISGRGVTVGTDEVKACCEAAFVDNLEIPTSLPDICFNCVGFRPISDKQAKEGEVSLIPPFVAANTSGFLMLTNCQAVASADAQAGSDPELLPIQDEGDQFIFAFHGMAVGPFGAIVKAKYSGGLE